MQYKVITRWRHNGEMRTDEQLYWRRDQAVSHFDRMKSRDSVVSMEVLNPDGERIKSYGA